jgi:SAM-dependent methyltransferase
MNVNEYHLRELEIARSVSDPRRVMPVVAPGIGRVLDIGCGAGQTLIAAEMGAARRVGIDCDFDALRLGKKLSSDIDLLRATGEALPFRDGTYDLVISRVALPYMHIPTAVREAARVLVPDGRVWFVLHPVSMLSWRSSASSLKRIVFQSYVAVNSLLLHFLGLQIRFPLNRAKIESVQTRAGMTRCLKSCGFDHIEWQTGAHFVVTARRR